MKIAIGNDHTALALKEIIVKHVMEKGHEVVDFGTYTSDMCDYPKYGFAVAEAVASSEVDGGILICGTGVGISLAANKVRGIRAAVCSEAYTAEMVKRHNNANIIAFGARVVGSEVAKKIVDAWIDNEFEGGMHAERIAMIAEKEMQK